MAAKMTHYLYVVRFGISLLIKNDKFKIQFETEAPRPVSIFKLSFPAAVNGRSLTSSVLMNSAFL